MNNYICKIGTLEEIEKKYQYKIDNSTSNKNNWIIWKHQAIDRYTSAKIIPYYGLLNNKIICEYTAAIDQSVV